MSLLRGSAPMAPPARAWCPSRGPPAGGRWRHECASAGQRGATLGPARAALVAEADLNQADPRRRARARPAALSVELGVLRRPKRRREFAGYAWDAEIMRPACPRKSARMACQLPLVSPRPHGPFASRKERGQGLWAPASSACRVCRACSRNPAHPQHLIAPISHPASLPRGERAVAFEGNRKQRELVSGRAQGQTSTPKKPKEDRAPGPGMPANPKGTSPSPGGL